MRIAVLAWGSLVWQPVNAHGALRLAGGASWRDDGPLLPVEFARISSDGRLTIVILPGYEHRSSVLWATSAFDTVVQAARNLAERETRAPLDAIHGVTGSGTIQGAPDPSIVGAVREWLLTVPGVDAAIWTGLPPGPRWIGEGHGGFSLGAAVAYFTSLEGEVRARAADYVRRAPAQIDTPVRRALMARLEGDPA